jgi:uncharacterized membrane protein YoaK (UPF0700 family)
MFRHTGTARTLKHNLRIASLLSFVAGIVNVSGFLAIGRLTTNVTGHFAFFVDEVFKLEWQQAFSYFLYVVFFFLGSFVSNFMVEWYAKRSERNIYVIPVFMEIILLTWTAMLFHSGWLINANEIAYILLFAMGIQNSLVTAISSSVVRTTHLTGLFTDLGIECSQLFFYKLPEEKRKLLATIKLRLTIITFFFMGGVTAGLLYQRIHLMTLLIGVLILIIGVVYDYAKVYLALLRRN